MSFQITCAPCCWGVDDPKNPYLPGWKRVLSEAGQAGYRGIELGPYGYLPLDSAEIQRELDKNNLFIIAGTIFDNLVDSANMSALAQQARNICRILAGLKKAPAIQGQKVPAPYLVLIDWGHDERDYAAGHPDKAPRLSPAQWKMMVGHIKRLAEISQGEFGIRSVIHHHAGGYIEFGDEIDAILHDVSDSEAGFLPDTGHLYYARENPIEWIKTCAARIEYVHFKDVNQKMYEQVMGERIRFFDAVAKGVMCPLGTGALDYHAILEALKTAQYSGYITVEQERDPRNVSGSLKDVTASLQFLKQTGFKK